MRRIQCPNERCNRANLILQEKKQQFRTIVFECIVSLMSGKQISWGYSVLLSFGEMQHKQNRKRITKKVKI